LVDWDPTLQSKTAATGIFFYLITYGFTTLGVFGIVIVMRQSATIGDSLDVLDGLYYRNPTVAVLLLILMLSLAGIPPTAGFMSKYLIFQALIETHHPALAIFASLSMIPGLYYYLRVVGHAWMRAPGAVPSPEPNSAEAVALAVTLFVTVAAGLYAEPFTRLARYAFGR